MFPSTEMFKLPYQGREYFLHPIELNLAPELAANPEAARQALCALIAQYAPVVNVVMIFYSTIKRPSFQNIDAIYLPAVQSACPYAPVVLVGTMIDIRAKLKAAKDALIHKGEGEAKSKLIENGRAHCEIRSIHNVGLQELFETALKWGVKSFSGTLNEVDPVETKEDGNGSEKKEDCEIM